jgi:hypothetical protein
LFRFNFWHLAAKAASFAKIFANHRKAIPAALTGNFPHMEGSHQ